jgi:type VI secretion system protein ImpI
MFEVISRQKFTATFPTSHVFSEAGGVIGRSEECEWVLPDKGKRISRRHAVISCDGKSFYIEDVSSNGVFTEPGLTPLEPNAPHRIGHGDSFTIGDFSILARLLYRPDAYIPSETDEAWPTPDNALSQDPLTAMDQQEEFEAKRRLGHCDDLLTDARPTARDIPADHNSVSTDSLLRVAVVPEPEGFDLPEDWNREEDGSDSIPQQPALERPVPQSPASQSLVPEHSAPDSSAPQESPGESPQESSEVRHLPCETEGFFRVLGFASAPESPAERERMLRQAAEIILAAVDGLHHCLRNQAECKNDLRLPATTMQLSGNNPLKFTPTPRVALEHLLGPGGYGMMPAGKAVRSGFGDLHAHHLGLLAGARASVKAVLDKLSPSAVATRLEGEGSFYFSRRSRLWHVYRKTHQALLEDHEGFAALFLHDFARAYEAQVRTLGPVFEGTPSKGDA